MNAEEPKPRRKALKIWIGVLCLLVVTGLAIVFVRSHRETITFKIVDAETGLPVTNVCVRTSVRWTQLPLEELPVPGVSELLDRAWTSESGVISVPLTLFKAEDDYINFLASGYRPAAFRRADRGHGVLTTGLKAREVTQNVALPTNGITVPLYREGVQP